MKISANDVEHRLLSLIRERPGLTGPELFDAYEKRYLETPSGRRPLYKIVSDSETEHPCLWYGSAILIGLIVGLISVYL